MDLLKNFPLLKRPFEAHNLHFKNYFQNNLKICNNSKLYAQLRTIREGLKNFNLRKSNLSNIGVGKGKSVEFQR